VLDPVLVARDEAAADLPVVGVLAMLVQLGGVAVEALDQPRADRGLLAEPDRRRDDEDVSGLYALVERGPRVARGAVLAHVRVDAGREVVIDRAELVDGDPVRLHDRHAHVDQPLRVRALR